jgi:hypothetical protein
LNRHPGSPSQFPDKESGHTVGGIPLIAVGLDHYPGIHARRVGLFVFGGVVRVHGMSHVHREYEGPDREKDDTVETIEKK